MGDKIEKLKSDLIQVNVKLEEFTQLKYKLLGAIEILESIEAEDSNKKTEKEEEENVSWFIRSG